MQRSVTGVVLLLPLNSACFDDKTVKRRAGGFFPFQAIVLSEELKRKNAKLMCIQTFSSFVRNYCLSVFRFNF